MDGALCARRGGASGTACFPVLHQGRLLVFYHAVLCGKYYGYLVSIVMYVVILIISVASMYMKQSKPCEEQKINAKEEVAA